MPAESLPPADQRFPRERRLLTRSDFDRVFKEGRKVVRPSFVVYLLPRSDAAACSRVGCVLSGKVGNAVVRNRLRRLIRETFRHHYQVVSVPSDVVVLARPSAKGADNARLRAQLLDALGTPIN